MEAKKVYINGEKGAIVLFDFKAAFPSIDHEYMWATLSKWGVPRHVLAAYKRLYACNKHTINVQGQLFELLKLLGSFFVKESIHVCLVRHQLYLKFFVNVPSSVMMDNFF